MPRVRFEEVGAHAQAIREARFRKPGRPPEGYTANTWITEWLTLNCKGVWGSQADNRSVHVRFSDPDDHARALAALPPMVFRRPHPSGLTAERKGHPPRPCARASDP